MSFSIAEDELRTLGVDNMVGDYACWNYFQSVRHRREQPVCQERSERNMALNE